ncbi:MULTISPECIES: PilX N-terminal domain-containing pilus assembly protein [unclassified Oleiphilus]|uniref:PilX N-terminal domain-containing pilus assembly protein n=6 Tax=Oleiphilus TaxID=141450 RepID=UPI0007C2EC46|nr:MULTISPECIES: PilX N-terminal domain-containing pilus assembly protein [unclassified Oleiphilus]KZY44995.1 hypothetical protein A3732_11315 [Oleiphilus sp. HI0050]KZY75352.1 hypothetical protein A3740_02460 [Oleiphilus sp. HI0068]KZY77702.1 hypothetical protein A3741_09225 [Oleiphilus sp. HI0069]KZZ47722.1 hypothetical protein A3755_14555 [Oleiphilus sp. HI0085]KZY56114.1 hypothetical protein A3735_04905 [Oleiphilus sp. HI0061]
MKTLQHQSSLNLARQKGAVLVVSLIILLLMTLIGVASMSSSIMQEKMASNAQNNNATFQAAENAVSGLINKVIIDKDTTELDEAIGIGTIGEHTSSINYAVSGSKAASSYSIGYMGVVALAKGGSLNVDESSTELKPELFEALVEGAVEATSAQTVIRQGFEYH